MNDVKRRNLAFLLGTLVVATVGCGSKSEVEKAAPAAGPAVAVRLTDVQQLDWPSFYEATGTVRARTSGQVSSHVMAYVREVRVRTGDRVNQGQTLVVLDARDLSVRKRQADAGRTEVQWAAREADQGVTAAQANVELAEVTFKRMKDLFDKRSISNQEFDEASAKVRMARASLEMARSRRKQIDGKIAQAQEEWNGAEIQAGYSIIIAPFSGVVTEKLIETGNLAVPGAPLLTIERNDGFRLEAVVDESNLSKVRRGQKVVVMLDALDHPIDATISEIAPTLDSASRSFIAKIDLPSVPNLRTGAYGKAKFLTGSRTALTVPVAAITERGQMQWVFVADGGKARGRIVTVGQRNGDSVEILSGLAAGEQVIAPVPAGLSDGARVEGRP